MTASRAPRVLLVVPNGIAARDFFVGGLAAALGACGARVDAASPAPDVMRDLPGASGAVAWHTLPLAPSAGGARAGSALRARARAPWLQRALWSWESRLLATRPMRRLLAEARPDVVVCPTPRYDALDIALVRAAAGRVPVVCVVSSWDNLHKGVLGARGDLLAVWSPAMADRAVDALGYRRDRVRVVGALQFTPYLRGRVPSRDRAFAALGLDPSRPLVVVATAGVLRLGLDERYLADVVRDAAPDAQFVLRVHPDEHDRYVTERPGLAGMRLHYGARVLPDARLPHRWFMGPDDYAAAATLLSHADLLVSLGSTLHLEAALFGTPSVVAGFGPAGAPEPVPAFLRFVRTASHLTPILDRGLLPYAADTAALAAYVRLAAPGARMEAGVRQALLDEFAGPWDGTAAARTAAVIVDAVARWRRA